MTQKVVDETWRAGFNRRVITADHPTPESSLAQTLVSASLGNNDAEVKQRRSPKAG